MGATKFNNGITGYIDMEPLYHEPCITVNYNGSVAEAFYQEMPFWNSDDVKVWIPNFESQEGTFPDACIATNFSLNENGDIM